MRTKTSVYTPLEVQNFIQASRKALKSKWRLDETHEEIHTVVWEDTNGTFQIHKHNSTQQAIALNISI